MSSGERPRLLVVGGFGGLLGRALLPELAAEYRLRSVHRHPSDAEARAGVEWVPGDVTEIRAWEPHLEGVSAVINLAWRRWGPAGEFRTAGDGLVALIEAGRRVGLARFLQVSVPSAPDSLEHGLPYLTEKRRVDRSLEASGIPFAILRPTAMFGRGDVLLGVMLRTIRRYPVFPMFGDGGYHLSPIAAADVARAIRLRLGDTSTGTFDLGGPRRFAYRELTDLMFRLVGKRARYWRLSPRGGVRLARLLETVGSSLLYAYEVEWLTADRLGLAPYPGLDRPLTPVEPYLESAVARREP